MASSKRKPEQVVRCFEVSSPTLHEKGHTVYKITQRLIRVDKQEEDVQEVCVWRRYNEIKRLYKAMYKLHLALHRKDEFPPFAEAKLFGRFDEDVIIERMRSAQDMLNFVGQRHYMVSHAAFKLFFEGGESTKCDPGEKVLKPQRVNKLSGDSDSDASLSSPTHQQGTPLVAMAAGPTDHSLELGGVWQYRQTGEELSLNGEEEEEEEDNTDTDSIISTPLPTDTNVFDPLSEATEESPAAVSNLWLLSSLQEEEEGSEQSDTTFHVGSEGGVDTGKSDLLTVSESSSSLPQNASPRRLAKPSSLLNLDLQDKGDYIVQAAKQISLAQHCEASNNYHLAFSYYKNGVGILLTGVQLDENETRREVVRRKTARYLIKAEEIHKQHLSQHLPASSVSSDTAMHPANRWDTGQLSPARELDPAIALLQGSFSELRHFKVLGILQSVMLVMDVNTDNTFVIKVLQKSVMDSPTTTSGTTRAAVRRCLVRARGPHMVELYRFYDNSDVIYLLLQHAVGGRLWSYVGHFLQDHATAVHELGDVYDHEKRLRSHTQDTEDAEEVKDGEGDMAESKAGHGEQIRDNMPRLERIDSALEDVDTVDKTIKHTVTIDPELQHVQFDASKQDSDLLSLNGSHSGVDGAQFESSLQHSSTVANTEDASEVNTTFQSLLEHTRKQALVGFAVDSSFESDMDNDGPPSRQLSDTIDRIEEEPINAQDSQLIDSVFVSASKDREECVQAVIDDSEEEPSIYDNQPPDISDSDSESLAESNSASVIDTHNKDSNTNNSQIKSETAEDTTSKSENSSNNNPHSLPSSPTVFRQVSRERSADPRRRKRTVSSAFEELDLAGEEESKQQRLPEACVRQWAAELVVAVDSLHQAGIICRDLKPANLLLGDRGHLLLSHFSTWSSVLPTDPDMDNGYVAPEAWTGRPLSPACDWWSVGALLYELLTSRSLVSCHPSGLTTHSILHLPSHLSPEAASLLTQLLRVAPAERLTVLDIKTHAFFGGIDWHELEKY